MSEETIGRFLCVQIFDTADDACNIKILYLERENDSYCDSPWLWHEWPQTIQKTIWTVELVVMNGSDVWMVM